MSEGFSGADTVERWLQPLSDNAGPCGANLEYDNDFLALTQAAAGKPAPQIGQGAATPPDWRATRDQAAALFERTRDLRVAMLWFRAVVNIEGFAAFPDGMRLLRGLLENFWDAVHPMPDPDDGDTFARISALGELREAMGLLGDLRRCCLFHARGFGDVRVRSVEIALGQVTPRDDEASINREQLDQMLRVAIEHDPSLRELPAKALSSLKALVGVLDDQVGVSAAPDLKPLQSLLYTLTTVMPAEQAKAAPDDAPLASEPPPTAASSPVQRDGQGVGKGLSGGVHSRDDALRAIDMVCDFLERTEPTNPAQLLLRRARRLVNQNFLQLMKELAPEALAEVARVMGVDPDSVQLDN